MNIAAYRDCINNLLHAQQVSAAEPTDYAAHYTCVETPRRLLEKPENNLMRQFDGDYMNDPEEGRYLVDVMIRAARACKHPHKELFVERLGQLRTSRLLYSAYHKCTFLSCWTITTIKPGDEAASDSLNHWRFYGADGKGSCLMIPLNKLVSVFPQQLYRVTYGTEARGGGQRAAFRPVHQLAKALGDRLNDIRKSEHNAMTDLEEVIQATHPLLFLFKSSEYASEREVRSIVHKDDYAKTSGVIFDDRDPRRAYINGKKGLISDGSIIHFGPKADHKFAIEAMGLADSLGLKVRVFVSSKPYR